MDNIWSYLVKTNTQDMGQMLVSLEATFISTSTYFNGQRVFSLENFDEKPTR